MPNLLSNQAAPVGQTSSPSPFSASDVNKHMDLLKQVLANRLVFPKTPPISATKFQQTIWLDMTSVIRLSCLNPEAGGVLAFEIARQLQIQGQKVALVAIIDAADVAAPKRIGRIAGQRLGSFSKALGQKQQLKPQEQVFYILNKVKEKVINLLVYEAKTKTEGIQNKFKMMLFRYYLDKKLRLPKFLQKIPVRTVYLFAEKEYVPQELYQGEVVLFRATKGVGSSSDEPYINIYSDPLFGWDKRVTKGVKVYDIPGGHSSMLQEPNVQIMAESINACINAVILEESVPERAPLVLETL